MKKSGKLKIALSVISAMFTVFCAASFNTAYASGISATEMRERYVAFLDENGLTEQTVTSGKITEFLRANAADFRLFPANKGGAVDMISEEGIEYIDYVFGRNRAEFLLNGGTIGAANGENITGRFKKTSASGVEIDESLSDGEFSVIIMGDQQTAVEYHSAYVAEAYDYIVENKDKMNLKAYINMGDIVDDCNFLSWRQPVGNNGANGFVVNYNPGRMSSYKMQLQFARNQYLKLLNADIPTAMVIGNHDYEDMAESYRIKTSFNEYFKTSDFDGKDYFGGSLYKDLEACNYYFEGNGQKYMVITLGTYPTDEMLEWANKTVSENKDCKVIVATHAYIDATTNDLAEYGMRIWDNFASLHENIFMLACGHDCTTDSTVYKRVDYGVHGNAVTQFMINPQIEEFGGAGIFSRLIFRNDGTVDFVYYSPYTANHNDAGYFMDENQFKFSLSPERPDIENITPTEVGNEITGETVKFNYLDFENGTKWKNTVYSYGNVKPTISGLTSETSGYVVHKLEADERKRFNRGSVTVDGFFGQNGAYEIDVSDDGEKWKTAAYFNTETGYFNRAVNIDRFVAGAKTLYIRLAFTDCKIASLGFTGGQIQTELTDENSTVSIDFTKMENPGEGSFIEGYIDGIYSKYMANLSNGVLASCAIGKLAYKSDIAFRYDAEEGRNIIGLNLDFSMRFKNPYYDVSELNNFEFEEKDTEYLYRVKISADGGKTYKTVKQYDYADYIVDGDVSEDNKTKYKNGEFCTVWAQIDLSGETGENCSDVIVKLEYFGAGRLYSSVGLTKVNVTVSYDSAIDAPDEEYEKNYVLNGGRTERGEPVKDGYTFVGWYLNPDLSGESVDPDELNDDNYTFYAKWKRKTFNITYVLDGGTNSAHNVSEISLNGELVLQDAAKEGYRFVGWYDENGKRVEKIGGDDIKDTVLYAVYAENGGEEKSGCKGSASAVYLPCVLAIVAALTKKRKLST